MKKKKSPQGIVIPLWPLIFIILVIGNILFIYWPLKGSPPPPSGEGYGGIFLYVISFPYFISFPVALIDLLCCCLYLKTVRPKGILKTIGYVLFIALSLITYFFGWIAFTYLVIGFVLGFVLQILGISSIFGLLLNPLFMVGVSILGTLLNVRFLLPKIYK